MKTGIKGALIASAVAVMFAATAVHAQEAASTSGSGTAAKVKCVGANDCKGHGACKSASNDCKGHNACKGKGFVETSSAQECVDKGGKVAAE
jgi:hypothetical protein